MSKFLNKSLSSLAPYVPGEQPRERFYIKLNTNELPYPPSPDVRSALNDRDMCNLRLYPDPTCSDLKYTLAATYGVGDGNVFTANGSDEILNFAFMAFGGSGVAYADITYGFYPVFAGLYGLQSRVIPLADDFTLNVSDYCETGMMTVIANPNAPTGIALPLSSVERIVASNPDNVVLIDEAYVDFGGASAVQLTRKYKNLIVCMTYSKSRGMAGARLGFAIADSELIADLERIRYSTNPYNIDRLTLLLGQAALSDASVKYYNSCCEKIARTRDDLSEHLSSLGAEVLPSSANFIFVRLPGIPGDEVYHALRERGILVRHFNVKRISDFNRISIGSDADMTLLSEEICEIIKEKK